MRNMAIKHKLMLIIMATCTAVLFLSAVIQLLFERGEFRKRTLESVSCDAEMIGENCRAALAFGDAEDAKQMLKSLQAESSIVFACVYTKDRKMLAGYQRADEVHDISSPECKEEGYYFDNNYFKLFKQIKDGNELVGTVYIQFDLSEGRARLWLKAGTIVLVVLVCSLIAYLVSLRLQQVISGPILSLAEVAKVVSEKEDYSIRATKQSNDEVGTLIDAFNEMLTQIQERDSALTDAKTKLETRVRERTAELSLAYKRTEGLNRLKGNLLSTRGLNEKLKCITDAIVKTFDADFARIWVIKQGDLCDSGCIHAKVEEKPHICRYRDRCLHLMVSSGRYTHIDGKTHRRVPFGCYKIGRIAAGEDSKFLTNDVTHDPRVHNHDWARDLGLVSFVGYRLVSATEEAIGVLALFAKHAISNEEDALLEGIANTTSQVIQMAMAEEELERTHKRLIVTSHQAGMAEVATDVLHNVGNVLNSINISANFVQDKILNSKAKNLKKVIDLISDHADHLGAFLTQDERGQHIPVYLTEVAKLITHEHTDITEKLRSLTKNVEHIKQIIKAQQGYARAGGVEVFVNINEVIEDAVEINSAILARDEIRLELDLAEIPKAYLDKQRVLQILVNLITNAKYALTMSEKSEKSLTIRCYRHNEDKLRIEVIDNGIGIPEENLSRIFRHGFTTRETGHGFGLHSSALAAGEIGGSLTVHSDGPGRGATFTLELPLKLIQESGRARSRKSKK